MSTRTRQLIYGLLAAALVVLIAVGAVRQEQADAITKLVTVALDVATAAMMIVAARHVTPDSWSGLRLAVYSLMAAVAALAAVFGIAMPPDWLGVAGQILDGIGVAVLALAAYRAPSVAEYDPQHD